MRVLITSYYDEGIINVSLGGWPQKIHVIVPLGRPKTSWNIYMVSRIWMKVTGMHLVTVSLTDDDNFWGGGTGTMEVELIPSYCACPLREEQSFVRQGMKANLNRSGWGMNIHRAS